MTNIKHAGVSKIDYHHIHSGDSVEVVGILEDVHPNIYKVILPKQKAIHYLYAFEIELGNVL